MKHTQRNLLGLPTRLTVTAGLTLAAASCGPPQVKGGGPESCPLPGDIVITEVMPDPDGADDGKEWVEIFNASNETINLEGLVLRGSKLDGTSESTHTFAPVAEGEDGGGEPLEIGPGEYLVVGGAVAEAIPEYVDYGYGSKPSLLNEAGTVAIDCGEDIIDSINYTDTSSGVSRAFDGGQAPDATANDNLDLWCGSVTEYDADFFATPGTQNDACAGGGPTTCMDGEQMRDVVRPSEGDLVISELHPDPDAVGDDVGEFFELVALTDVDLNGLEIGRDVEDDPDATISAAECISVAAGDHVIVSKEADMALNGGLPESVGSFSFGLSNSGGTLYIGVGGDVLDEVTYGGSSAGTSINLDPDFYDTAANDDPMVWCDATEPYGDGDLGTPAALNTECAIAPPDGMCAEDGELRPIMVPASGDLVLSEFMANPDAVGDGEGEWIEIYASSSVDLNGLELGRDEVEDTVISAECITVPAEGYVVGVKDLDSAVNGGIEEADFVFNFSLNNSNKRLFVGYDGEVLDEYTYSSTDTGASSSLDPSSLDTVANDDSANWCAGVDPYGDGDLGTPGAENPVCVGDGDGDGDGECMDGDMSRPINGPGQGDLVISEFMANPDAVGDTDGEWIEIYVNADVDLNELVVGRVNNDNKTTLNAQECLSFSEGDYVLVARKDADNGGLPAADFTFGWSLVNSNSGIYLEYDGMTVDTINFTSTSAGSSTQLDPGSLDAAVNDTADDSDANWCYASSPYGDGDNGTPGAENDQCG